MCCLRRWTQGRNFNWISFYILSHSHKDKGSSTKHTFAIQDCELNWNILFQAVRLHSSSPEARKGKRSTPTVQCVPDLFQHEGQTTHHDFINVLIFLPEGHTHCTQTPPNACEHTLNKFFLNAETQKHAVKGVCQHSQIMVEMNECNCCGTCTHAYKLKKQTCTTCIVLSTMQVPSHSHTHCTYCARNSHTNTNAHASWRWIMNACLQLSPPSQLTHRSLNPILHLGYIILNFSPALYHLPMTPSLRSVSTPQFLLFLLPVSELELTHAVWLWILLILERAGPGFSLVFTPA